MSRWEVIMSLEEGAALKKAKKAARKETGRQEQQPIPPVENSE